LGSVASQSSEAGTNLSTCPDSFLGGQVDRSFRAFACADSMAGIPRQADGVPPAPCACERLWTDGLETTLAQRHSAMVKPRAKSCVAAEGTVGTMVFQSRCGRTEPLAKGDDAGQELSFQATAFGPYYKIGE